MSAQGALIILFILVFLSMLASITLTFVWVYKEEGSKICPPGWRAIGQECVHAFDTPGNFTQAKEICEADKGAILVSIHSKEENVIVAGLLQHEGWMNGRLYKNNWIWGDGTGWDFKNWKSAEPALENSCLKILPRGEWVTSDCSDVAQGFVCKLKPNGTKETITTPDPTTTTTEQPREHDTFAWFPPTPEVFFGFSLYWLPGICLSLYGILMTLLGMCNYSPAQSGLEMSVFYKLLISVVHGFLPLQLLALRNFFKTPVRLFWFFDNRKVLYSNAAGFFYGQIFDLCLKLYVFAKTPIVSLPFLTYISILSGLRVLVVTSMKLFLEEEDGEPPVSIDKILAGLQSFFCQKKKKEKNDNEPKQGILGTIITFLKEQMAFLKYVPLFLPNSLFKILAMVQIFVFCEKERYSWVFFVFIASSLLIIFTMSFLYSTDMPVLTRANLTWTNFSVLSVQSKDVDLAVMLHLCHYFINIVALSSLVFLRPEDYMVSGILIVGFISLIPLAWQVRTTSVWKVRDILMQLVKKLEPWGMDGIIPISFKRTYSE